MGRETLSQEGPERLQGASLEGSEGPDLKQWV